MDSPCVALLPFSNIVFQQIYNSTLKCEPRNWSKPVIMLMVSLLGVFSDGESSSCRKGSPRCLFIQTGQHHRRRDRATAASARSGLKAPHLYECLRYKSVKHEYRSTEWLLPVQFSVPLQKLQHNVQPSQTSIHFNIWRHLEACKQRLY